MILHAASRIAQQKNPNLFTLIYNAIKDYDFDKNLYEGLLEPFLNKMHSLETDAGFQKADCIHSRHLFYRSILRYIHLTEQPDNEEIRDLYLLNMKRSDTRLKPSLDYYLQHW